MTMENLTETDNWWVKLIKAKHLNHHSFCSVPKRSNSSITWKGILDSRDILSTGSCWILGNVVHINFWLFNRLYPFPLIHFVPEAKRSQANT